jgi:hypothetical protein
MADIDHGNMRVYTVAFTKVDGSPGTVEGPPQWSLSDETFAALSAAADGMTCKVKHTGAVGPDTDVVLTVKADGDLDLGDDQVHPIALTTTITMKTSLGSSGGTLSEGEQVPADF